MEQYLIRRKQNGQFSKKGRVVRVKKSTYWKTFNWSALFLGILIVAVIVYLIFT